MAALPAETALRAQRARSRRLALLLALVAIGFYAGFIALGAMKGVG